MLPIKIIISPALKPVPGHYPVFMLFGGPGQAATDFAAEFSGGWENAENDLVFVDQRGTGEGHRLDCDNLPGSPSNPASYLEPVFQPALFAACRDALSRRFDLTQYSTPIAVEDFDEIRTALGFEKINLDAGSYGTRAALTYIRQHPEHINSAWLVSADPYGFRNPLFHARAAQDAVDGVIRLCAAEVRCRRAFPNPRKDLDTVLERLERQPATVHFNYQKRRFTAKLARDDFAEGLRTLLYSVEDQQRLPFLLRRAANGDLEPFILAALDNKRDLRDTIRFGLLQTIVCNEDAKLIKPWEIAPATAQTFLGDTRVRHQLASCEGWPTTQLPFNFATPFASNVPTVIVSGDLDPSTPPRWGEQMSVYLPNSIHVIVPGGHSPSDDCANSLGQQLFANKPLSELDQRCIQSIRRPRFFVPGKASHSPARAS